MIIYPTGIPGQNYNFPYNNLIIDWTSYGSAGALTQPVQWKLGYALPFHGLLFNWTHDVYGTTSGASTGNLQFIFTGQSMTLGVVKSFNDGIINIPQLNISAKFPLVRACIEILQNAGATARPYKLDVIRDGVTLFTLRSVIWGTIMVTEDDPAYQIIDQQLKATVNPAL